MVYFVSILATGTLNAFYLALAPGDRQAFFAGFVDDVEGLYLDQLDGSPPQLMQPRDVGAGSFKLFGLSPQSPAGPTLWYSRGVSPAPVELFSVRSTGRLEPRLISTKGSNVFVAALLPEQSPFESRGRDDVGSWTARLLCSDNVSTAA